MRRVQLAVLLLTCSSLVACAPEGPTAFVSHNIPPDDNCVVSPSMTMLFIPTGLYDIASGRSGFCERPYMLNLLVNSSLRTNQDKDLGRSEPNVLQIHSAEVRLMNLEKATISFPTDPPLPNPFLVTTNNSIFPSDGEETSVGIAAVEAIPVAYAPHLDSFVDRQILAEVQIFGTTTGDVDVDLKPFVYPIELCDGCLTLCVGDILGADMTIDEVVEGCADNAGADYRACLDPDC